jgi:hypothetical protein
MKHILDMYEDAFRRHGDSPHAVLWPKGRQEERFHALTRNIRETGDVSLLDYGCGLAHLKQFLDGRFRNVQYSGADAVASFVETCKQKYPCSHFQRLQSPGELKGNYDYIVSSGVFNILYTPEPIAHRDIVFGMLTQLFERTNIYLSVNFMTDVVDFRQPDTYHQNVAELYTFVFEKLSRRLVLDQSYMPYEYTITVWKDQTIGRPENLYGNR